MGCGEEALALDYIVPLTGDLGHGKDVLGGKGYNLQRLMHGNFQVPAGFIVTTRAFREVLALAVDGSLPGAGIDGMARRMEEVALPRGLEDAICGAVATLRLLSSGPVVVRSSATSEDVEESSMAGQNATLLNVRGDREILAAVRKAWGSMFTLESLTYRSCHTGAGEFPEMAVVVQRMVDARRAGVLFTVNPLTGNTGQCLLAASWGLGETVVSGRGSDTLVLDKRSGRVLDVQAGEKSEILVPVAGGGTRWEHLDGERARKPAVDEGLVRKLLALGRHVEAAFGAPQDIEWAEGDGRVWLLQARPVTGKRKGESRTVWSNANVGEALPGVATPFTWSIIEGFSRKGFVHAFSGLGCTVPSQYRIVGSVRGRVFLNLSEFMSVASQVPFISADMLMRVGGGGGVAELDGTYRRLSSAGFLARLPGTAAWLAVSRAVEPARVALWSQAFKKFCVQLGQTRLETLSDEELLALYRRTDQVFEDTGTLTLQVSAHFLMNYLLTSLALKRVLGGRAQRVERLLFSGLSGIRSAEPGLDLLRMARKVAASERLRRKVLDTAVDRLLVELSDGDAGERSLRSAIGAFLESHGHRAAREAEMSVPRWREDPTFPLSVLQKYLLDPRPADPEAMVRDRIRRREETTKRLVRSLPAVMRPAFERLLRSSHEAARSREEMRNAVVKTIGFYRALALEVGRRMVASGLLRRSDEVFYVTRPEQVDFLGGCADEGKLSLSAVLRRLEHEALELLPDPPGTFVMEGDRLVAPQVPVSGGVRLSGLPGSPGTASGRVVVVRSPSEQGKMRQGDVLVAPLTDVGWTPLFLVAGAVVTELGGPLSHSCVVAREYGVPAVVNVKDATFLLKDGDHVTVDGDSGAVMVERKREPSATAGAR
jgi:pyruvate,water dikinase